MVSPQQRSLWRPYWIVSSLRESTSLPCKQVGRQRGLFARQRLCRAKSHGKDRTAMSSPAMPSLPCASQKLHGKGFAVRSYLCREPRPFAVKRLIAVRRPSSAVRLLIAVRCVCVMAELQFFAECYHGSTRQSFVARKKKENGRARGWDRGAITAAR